MSMCDNDIVSIKCQSFRECDIYLDCYFSHLEEDEDNNIFDPNKTQNDISPFRLTVNSLQRLIMTKAERWLNDVDINPVVRFLNFHVEYEPATKISGAQVPSVCFGDTSIDNNKLNPRDVKSYKQVSLDFRKMF